VAFLALQCLGATDTSIRRLQDHVASWFVIVTVSVSTTSEDLLSRDIHVLICWGRIYWAAMYSRHMSRDDQHRTCDDPGWMVT